MLQSVSNTKTSLYKLTIKMVLLRFQIIMKNCLLKQVINQYLRQSI